MSTQTITASPYLSEKIFSILEDGWVSLHSSNPAVDDPSLSELTGVGYGRAYPALQAVGAHTLANSVVMSFTNLPPVVITHFGLWTQETGGDLLLSLPMDSARRMRDISQLIIDVAEFVVLL